MKIIEINYDSIILCNNKKEKLEIYSYHNTECSEDHYLDFSVLKDTAFEDMQFCIDIENPNSFFCKVANFGIKLLPINDYPIFIPRYGNNNGYYSDDINLIVIDYVTKKNY